MAAFLGPLLSAGVGGANLIASASAQADQRNLGYLSLFEQKRQAREREKLAKATRSDAYGNKIEYIPGVGFVTKVTPTTQAILNSQQKEQLAQFRDDAPRVRNAAIRIDKRAKTAGDVYDKKFNKYRYGREKSEKEYIAEAIRNTIDARRGKKHDTTALTALANAAMRTGNTSSIPHMLKAAKKASGTDLTLAEAIAKAKQQGTQQFFAEKNAKNQSTFGELNNLRGIADAVLRGNMNWNNENAALSGRADNALSNLITTNAQSANAVGGAYNSVATAAGRSPDFAMLGNAVGKLQFPKQQSSNEMLLADLLLQQKIGSARVGIGKNNQALSMFKGGTGTF